MSHDVPSGWRRIQLGDVAKCEMGETLIHKDLTGDGIPVFSASTDEGPWGWTSHSKKRFKRGTLVIGARGSLGHPRLPDYDEFVSTQTTIAIHPSPSGHPAFLLYALQSAELERHGAKQAVPMLTVKALNEVPLLFPPLPEQRRIAEILSSVDEAIQATEAVIERTLSVRDASIRNILMNGIGHSRLKETEIGRIPDTWDVAPISSYGKISTGKTPSTSKPEFWDGHIPFITPGDLSEEVALVRGAERFVTEAGAQTGRLLAAGSVLVTCIGSTIGKVGIVDEECLVNQQINAIECGREVSNFVYELARSLKSRLRALSGKQAVPIVNKGTFEAIPVPLPPHQEQVAISNAMRSFAETIRFHFYEIERLKCVKAALMSDLLTGQKRVTNTMALAAE